jgi:hypothetical protein
MNASAMLAQAAVAPPRIAFGCGIGITGHRAEALPEIARGTIQARLKEVLGLISEGCHAIALREASHFSDRPPALTMVSPLAAGTDQMTAEIALSLGYRLHAVLPFARDEYARDFDPGELAHFERLLGRATGVFELPGKRSESMEIEAESYAMAGRATIAHCDILVAVWDGLPARGRGGTAEVVLEALQRGLPIIHIPVAGSKPIRMIWSGFDPHVVTHAHNTSTAERPFSRPLLDDLLTRLLAPPDDPQERSFLRAFAHERERNLKPRIEYPLLLAAAGIKPLRRAAWHATPYAESTRADWAPFRAACADSHGISADIDMLEEAYCWSDGLASHFAQTYRSGHVFNFVLGAAAVMLALTGLIVPDAKKYLAVLELLVLVFVIINTNVGGKSAWHRRWLDYRQLAERLRPMRSLKLLGLAAPDRATHDGMGGATRWVDWYAAGIWRAVGLPSGVIDPDRPRQLALSLAEHEIEPQIAYHKRNSHLIHLLDHRLHQTGTALFVATIISCVVLVVGLTVFPEWTLANAKPFVFIAAGLPACGTALFGIRVQGDFAGTAARSHTTAEQLEMTLHALKAANVDLPRAGDLFEQSARAMLADLDQWRMSHHHEQLALP